MIQKIVVLDASSLGDNIDLNPLATLADHVEVYDATTPTQVNERVFDADVVISNKVVLDAACILQASKLKLICVAATGVNNIDVEAAKRAGVTVSNVVNYGAETVAQHTFALILALTNKVSEYNGAIAQGEWSRQSNFCLMHLPVTELAGKTIMLCGYGAIAQSVERIAKAFGMTVLISARKGATASNGRISFSEGLKHADIVTIHCPLTPETTNLISTSELQVMKPTAVVINTARGGIVDEVALKNALIRGEIAGAAMDVLTEEPPELTHILLDKVIPNLVLTPHCAWTATEARQRLIQQVIDNIQNYLQGSPSNLVN